MEKKCNKCLISKSLDKYSKCKLHKDGLQYSCKECQIQYRKKHKKKLLEEGRKDQIPDSELSSTFKVCSICSENKPLTEYFRNLKCKGGFYTNCKKCNNERNKKFAKNNPEKMREFWRKTRENIQNRLKSNLSRRIRNSIKTGKESKTLEYIGCSMEEFKRWLEYQFTDDMSWENYGKLWNLDHVIPCKDFDLTSEENIKKCFIWENTRPLNSIENFVKNCKIQDDVIEKHKQIVIEYKLLNLSGTP